MAKKRYVKLRAKMIEKGITQEELAKKIGIGVSTFSAKINGKRIWDLDECIKIVEILGTTLDKIFLPEKFPYENEKPA